MSLTYECLKFMYCYFEEVMRLPASNQELAAQRHVIGIRAKSSAYLAGIGRATLQSYVYH